MKALRIIGTFMFAFLWASTAYADIYTWKDANGVMHFTNVAPPPQARVLIKDIPEHLKQRAERARHAGLEERLKRSEERADELEQDLDEAREKAREALQKARATEERLVQADRLAEETRRIQQTSYRYEETWEEGDSRYPYDRGYVSRAAPLGRSIRSPYNRRYPRISHYKKARHGKSHYGKHHYRPRPRGGRRHNGVVGVNRARTQSYRIFNKSRSNPLQSNFVSRRAIY